MNSKENILSAIRQSRPAETPALPENISFDAPSGDLAIRFGDSLRSVGGALIESTDSGAIKSALQERYGNLEYTASLYPEILTGNVDLAAIADPHQLALLDLVLLRGQFGVAENGAIWLTEEDMGGHRALPFISQHLVVVLNRADLVATLHDAYARVDPAQSGFGLFLSGPSKTADIEQALVIGAHGARSLTVVLYPAESDLRKISTAANCRGGSEPPRQ